MGVCIIHVLTMAHLAHIYELHLLAAVFFPAANIFKLQDHHSISSGREATVGDLPTLISH